MLRSLCALAPVTDAASRVESLLGELLELLPDFSAQFEVWLIDNGSRDETSDVARDLARRYPQLRVLRSHVVLSRERVLTETVKRSRAGWLLVVDTQRRGGLSELANCWRSSAGAACLMLPGGPAAVVDSRRPLGYRRGAGDRVAEAGWPTLPPGDRWEPADTWHILRRELVERFGWPPRHELAGWLSQIRQAGYDWMWAAQGAASAGTLPPMHLVGPRVRRARGPWAAPLSTVRG